MIRPPEERHVRSYVRLHGRMAAWVTTHWVCHLLARLFPAVQVDPGVLHVDDGDVLTSAGVAAGVAAGLDLCLHIVPADHGAAVAADIARRTVVAPHREGGQAQFIHQPIPQPGTDTSVAPIMTWALDHLDQRLDLLRLAAVARMSVRNISRRFRDETGTTPLQWLLAQRVAHARELLETTNLTVETVAHRCGFTDAPTLRRHFARHTGTAPRAYRVAFSLNPVPQRLREASPRPDPGISVFPRRCRPAPTPARRWPYRLTGRVSRCRRDGSPEECCPAGNWCATAPA